MYVQNSRQHKFISKGDEEGDTGENKNKKERKRGRNKKRPGPQRFDRNIRYFSNDTKYTSNATVCLFCSP